MAAPKKRRNPLINMDGDNNDGNYRYKFEKLIIHTEDDILGTKIVTDNNNNSTRRHNKTDIKKTAQHIAKYIGKKLGGHCQFKKGRDVASISGVYQQYELQNVLFDYVKQYAMCPDCNIPELTPVIHSHVKCKSCGYTKNDKNTKKHKKNKKDEKKENKKQKKKKKAIAKKRRQIQQLQQINEESKANDNDKDNRAKIARDPIFALNYFMAQNENVLCDEIMEKIKILSIAHTLDRKQQIKMIIYVLMNYEEENYKLLIESIKKYSQIFETFTMLENDTEIFLAYFEEAIIRKAIGDNLLNHSSVIFNCLYDEDIIGEDEINEWYNSLWHKRFTIINKDEAQLIRDKTKVFIAWLENAETDEDDDQD